MAEQILIKTESVSKSYRMGTVDIQVLKGADIAVKKGEFVAIIGASGSGKSTLLHILGTLDKPDLGMVRFNDLDISKTTSRELNKIRNQRIGFVFQFYHLLEELNILENVLIPIMIRNGVFQWLVNKKQARETAKELLNSVGLSERLTHKPSELSGGERQRTAICRALINQPELLLADEPTGNLDTDTGDDILKLLEKLNSQGQTIVMVTHDQKVAQRANRILVLKEGKVEQY